MKTILVHSKVTLSDYYLFMLIIAARISMKFRRQVDGAPEVIGFSIAEKNVRSRAQKLVL